jgi:hypothetical protein
MASAAVRCPQSQELIWIRRTERTTITGTFDQVFYRFVE